MVIECNLRRIPLLCFALLLSALHLSRILASLQLTQLDDEDVSGERERERKRERRPDDHLHSLFLPQLASLNDCVPATVPVSIGHTQVAHAKGHSLWLS